MSEINQKIITLLLLFLLLLRVYIKTNIAVLRRCFCSKLALIVWSRCFLESQVWKCINYLQELKNLQDKQQSITKKHVTMYGWSLRVIFNTIPCEWWDTNMFWGLRSIMPFGFTNVFSIAAVTITIIN